IQCEPSSVLPSSQNLYQLLWRSPPSICSDAVADPKRKSSGSWKVFIRSSSLIGFRMRLHSMIPQFVMCVIMIFISNCDEYDLFLQIFEYYYMVLKNKIKKIIFKM